MLMMSGGSVVNSSFVMSAGSVSIGASCCSSALYLGGKVNGK